MQLNKIAALVALACAGLSGQVMAASMTPAQAAIVDSANDLVNGGTGANPRILFISGASAVQKGFTSIISTLIPGTKVYFSDKNGKDTTSSVTPLPNNVHNYEAVAGLLDSNVGGPWAGQNVIIVYRVAGGSVWGVNPVARGEAIESLNVTSGGCGDGGYAAATGAAATDVAFVCPVTDALNYKVPDAGISDVAPALFKQPFNTEGEPGFEKTQLTEAELAVFSNTAYNSPLYSLAFGIPVTNNVNVNLNKAKVAAIMSGAVSTWDKVDSSLAGDDIVICRRVLGSGTQAVENMYFGNFPCGPSNSPAARDINEAFDPAAEWTWTDTSVNPAKVYSGTGKYTIGANTGTTVVVENSSSGDVRTCLDKAVSGGSYVTKNRDGTDQYHLVEFTGTHKAIGVLSMDSLSSSKTTANGGKWQFRSLDVDGTYTAGGVASGTAGRYPSQANLINGTWDMQGWISFNTPARTESNDAKIAMITKIIAAAKDPAKLAAAGLTSFAAALPGGAYSGTNVQKVGYQDGNQCSPLTLQ